MKRKTSTRAGTMRQVWVCTAATLGLFILSTAGVADPPKGAEVTKLLDGKTKVTYTVGKPVQQLLTPIGGLTDAGLRELTQINEYKDLRLLDLGGSWSLTDAALKDLKKFKSLETLYLYADSKITDAG